MAALMSLHSAAGKALGAAYTADPKRARVEREKRMVETARSDLSAYLEMVCLTHLYTYPLHLAMTVGNMFIANFARLSGVLSKPQHEPFKVQRRRYRSINEFRP